MKIKVHGSGKLGQEMTQQQAWRADEQGSLEFGSFAGQEMIVKQEKADEKDGYELHYLGFVATGFKNIDAAKAGAPEFARTVLSRLYEMIAG